MTTDKNRWTRWGQDKDRMEWVSIGLIMASWIVLWGVL